jgi:hypothetical protein
MDPLRARFGPTVSPIRAERGLRCDFFIFRPGTIPVTQHRDPRLRMDGRLFLGLLYGPGQPGRHRAERRWPHRRSWSLQMVAVVALQSPEIIITSNKSRPE